MATTAPLADILTGRTEQHLIMLDNGFAIHHAMQHPWQQLYDAAKAAGIHLTMVSAFRSFERQATIWQAKYEGRRKVYDLQQHAVDLQQLQGYHKLSAILLYSALPGASRHHWGTELDLYDAAAVSNDYQPRLQTAEYMEGGPFYPMVQWLQQHATDFGFYFPYKVYQGGVAAEPWHLSFRPQAGQYATKLTVSLLRECLLLHPVAGQQLVLQYLPDIYRQFITNTCEDLI
ncbi:M15 family metallopeptidase [Chromatiaceae bacterium AAb-1]|nr:M15 family metallopeptidase [Chromatiaceae bacterium AAb-1]